MECYVHPDQHAVGACVACGHFVCDYCRVNMQGKIYCKTCLERGDAAPPPPPGPGGPQYQRPPPGAGFGAGGWRRSRSNRVFAGVCGGIAPELNMDASLVRLLFALLTLFTGVVPGVIAYCVLWAVLPEE